MLCVPRRTLEVEGQEVKFLQLFLVRGKDAQDLLMQTENSAWYQDTSRRAGILVL